MEGVVVEELGEGFVVVFCDFLFLGSAFLCGGVGTIAGNGAGKGCLAFFLMEAWTRE